MSESRNRGQQRSAIGELPEGRVDVGVDQPPTTGQGRQLNHLERPGKDAQPGQAAEQAEVHGRHQHQGEQGAGDQTADDGDGERGADAAHVFGLAHGQGQHGQDSAQRGDQNRPDADLPGGQQGAPQAEAAPLQQAGVVDEHDAVVDHHAEENQETDQDIGVEDRIAGQNQSPESADGGQGQGDHHRQRSDQRLEDRGEDHVDEHHRSGDQKVELAQVEFVVDHFHGHAGRNGQTGDQAIDSGPGFVEQLVRGVDLSGEVVGQLHLLFLVDPIDVAIPRGIGQLGQLQKRHRTACGGGDLQPAQVVGAALGRRIALENHVDLFGPALQARPGRDLRLKTREFGGDRRR